jgi:hypothetical protein
MRKLITAFAMTSAFMATSVGAAVPTPTPTPTLYQLAMDMSAGGTLISQPRLVITTGEPAEIVIEPGDGASYRATITISPVEGGKLAHTSAFAVISTQTGAVTATPQLVISPDAKFALQFGVDSPARKPFRADLVISRIAP